MIIRKLFKAEVAHRVRDAYTCRCRGLHGHSYKFEIFLKDSAQDGAQMLMDFKLLKEKVNNFLDSFDHSLLIEEGDEYLIKQANELNPRHIVVPYNPTAEQMARHIYKHIAKLGMPICRVIVHETDTGCAIFENDDEIEIVLERVIFSEAIRAEWK